MRNSSDQIKPDAENPEWTKTRFARAKHLDELPQELQATLKRKTRGRQKTLTKVPISIRLSADVLKAMRATGRGWHARADEALRRQFVK